MMLKGLALSNGVIAGRLRAVRRPCAAALATLLTFAGVTLVESAAAWAAGGLPPVQITYSGSMSLEGFPAPGKPAHQVRTLNWTASSSSAGSDGSLPLNFSSVSGSASIEGNNDCYDSTATLSLATAKNPTAGGWFLNETSDYPNPGWKYTAPGAPAVVPVLEALTGRCSSIQTEALPQTNEMLLTQETFSATQQEEYEALFAQFEFTPGTPAARTRTFSFDGTSHCTCLPSPTHVKESMSLTVSATSPAAGNNVPTSPAPSGGGSSPGGPTGTPPRLRPSEARLKEIKEQARADLGPALEEDWKAHGLSAALGLNSGLAFSTVLDELGAKGTALEGNDAAIRVIDDYRIINDPPDRQFKRLATPRAHKRPALPSCSAIPRAERRLCARLRAAELAMLINSGKADAIDDALLVTVNRDSTAIRAHDDSAAQRQYVHFRSLHGELLRVLKSRGSAGGRVAAVLRSVNVSGVLTGAQSAAAIGAVEAKLSRAGIPVATLGTLAEGALEARETNALETLASPHG